MIALKTKTLILGPLRTEETLSEGLKEILRNQAIFKASNVMKGKSRSNQFHIERFTLCTDILPLIKKGLGVSPNSCIDTSQLAKCVVTDVEWELVRASDPIDVEQLTEQTIGLSLICEKEDWSGKINRKMFRGKKWIYQNINVTKAYTNF